MATRTHDKPYDVYRALQDAILVRCPKCGGEARLTLQKKEGQSEYFMRYDCMECFAREEKSRHYKNYHAANTCDGCGRYYRVDLPVARVRRKIISRAVFHRGKLELMTEKAHYKTLRVACPHCGKKMNGEVRWTETAIIAGEEIQDGHDTVFGLPLYFLSHFDSHPVWALNREHLTFLIGYISADLREGCGAGAFLPKFMKMAKNRNGILKVLQKMQKG
ncbi:MAG: hypothetical protein LBD67_00975 [Candidatus Accumulibacter sp.]|jgi:endogenous inhibitor of DNA gyrase (YacG/DUF329 family)|nr:hypothetical protein [Accumulibacter sp.]